jgi:hypothetical protein
LHALLPKVPGPAEEMARARVAAGKAEVGAAKHSAQVAAMAVLAADDKEAKASPAAAEETADPEAVVGPEAPLVPGVHPLDHGLNGPDLARCMCSRQRKASAPN